MEADKVFESKVDFLDTLWLNKVFKNKQGVGRMFKNTYDFKKYVFT